MKYGIWTFLLVAIVSFSLPAFAQTRVKKDSLEKANWYTAPREFQIIDDRPVVKDFRSAPPGAGTVSIPNGNGYSQEPVRMNTSSLPQSGFATNIPASGIRSNGPLPGVNRGVMGRTIRPRPVVARGSTVPQAVNPGSLIKSYGGYGTASGGVSTSTQAQVRGRLLRGK